MNNPPIPAGILSLLALVFFIGCGKSDIFSEFKERNKTNVAKVSTCFKVFASRNNNKSPKSQEELVAFMKEERVAKNLERLGLDLESLDDIFESERDEQPLKIRWGVDWDPEMPTPVAFETEGVDGIRLVGADVVLEISDDEEYEQLWQGNYEPEWLKLKRAQQGTY